MKNKKTAFPFRYYLYLLIAAAVAISLICAMPNKADAKDGKLRTRLKEKRLEKENQMHPSPQKQDCDSAIQASLLAYINASDTDTSGIQVEILRCVKYNNELKLQIAAIEAKLILKPKEVQTIIIVPAPADKQKAPKKIKIKNSYNDITKRSNNEDIRLSNSVLIKDATIDSLTMVTNILDGKLKTSNKEIERLKNSTKGDNSPNTIKSGNTTSKAPIIAWVIVGSVCLIAGRLSRHIPQLKWLP